MKRKMSEEMENLLTVNGEEDEVTGADEVTKIPTKAEHFIQQLNARNAKKVALLLVLGFILYHGIINWQYGSDSCQWLLSKGRFKGDNEWQPYGCMMHKYTLTDTRRCLRYLDFWGNKNYFVFIGDASIRMLYQSFINHIHPTEDDNISLITDQTLLKDMAFQEKKLNVHIDYIYADYVSPFLLEKLSKFKDLRQLPAVFVIGFTYHNFRNGNITDDLLKVYKENLTRLIVPFDHLVATKAKVLWKLQDHVNEEKLPDLWKNIDNESIDKLNQIAYEVFQYSDCNIWTSAWHIANGLVDNSKDGWKLSNLGLRHEIQILLNMYCNDYMNYNDGTCCSSAEPYTNLQIITYAVFGVSIALVIGMFLRKWCLSLKNQPIYTPLNQQQQHQQLEEEEEGADVMINSVAGCTSNSNSLSSISSSARVKKNLISKKTTPSFALALLGIILMYFYLCDRTNFFMKENKYYSEFSFWIPVGYVFALGLFFTEDSRYTKVLNPDQMDELKGWIMLVLLIYYMTGAHRVLAIHMHIKLLISGYLFLMGYTHFSEMWQNPNSNTSYFVRFFQIMFQMNFMTVILCFCMNRPYQFYYFIPLLTFWTCILYILISIPPRITAQTVETQSLHYFYLVAKLLGCLSIITILYMSEVFFERIFVTRPWKALFVTTDDEIHEWWYQWKLDRYTVTFGMIFATCFHLAQKSNIFDDNNHGNLFARRTSISVTLLAFCGVGIYTLFSFLCRNEQNCEEIHSYIVFIPIIGYVVLRNISGILRTRYSTFFAWFGKISLELFICQYHIWLAADRHGVLVLLPGFPTLNMIITSFIFVCISHEIHRITQVLLPFAVPNDWKLVLRNFIIFIVILIPVGRSDGMF